MNIKIGSIGIITLKNPFYYGELVIISKTNTTYNTCEIIPLFRIYSFSDYQSLFTTTYRKKPNKTVLKKYYNIDLDMISFGHSTILLENMYTKDIKIIDRDISLLKELKNIKTS
jgi:hypothetical protein